MGNKQTDLFVPNGTHVTKAKVVRFEQIRLLGKIGRIKMRKIRETNGFVRS